MAEAQILKRRSHRVESQRGPVSGLERYRSLLGSSRRGPNDYLLLLDVEALEVHELVRAVQRGLPYEAFESLVANTRLDVDTLLGVIDVPARTLTRRKQEGHFRPDESDRLVRASRIFAGALSLFDGDRDASARWLTEPKHALKGASPMAMSRTEVGALEVERLIGRLEHGVFS